MKFIQSKLKYCRKCKSHTEHVRNNNKQSNFSILLCVFISVVTMGGFLFFWLAYVLLSKPWGGWKCTGCMHKAKVLNFQGRETK